MNETLLLDPATGLIAGLLVLAALLVLFLPRRGLLARWNRMRRTTVRVLLEDAMKHIHDSEYQEVASSLQSVAGALEIPVDEATRVVERLEAMHLVVSAGSSLQLTAQGRSYALRVIRIHRLIEHYLADETGLAETEWHEEAERREHTTTAEEADALAARMGNPGFDPHGDPIPTAEGVLPRKRGIRLPDLAVGRAARIVHLEDEPHVVYAQLVAEGLYPGLTVRMIEARADRVRFVANDEESLLAPLLARNITVQPLAPEERPARRHDTLAMLSPGDRGTVVGISRVCRRVQRRRLMDLGFVPGTRVTAELASIGRDPVAYRVRGSVVALRKSQAVQIFISREEEKV